MVLSDYLLDIKVKDALKEDPLLVQENISVEKLNEIMLLKQPEEVLVIDKDRKIVGIITRNDLAKSLAKGVEYDAPISRIMTSEVIFMPPEMPLTKAREEMRRLGIGRAPVLDETGKLLGILTAKSICDAFSSQLEKAAKFQEIVLNNLESAVCVMDENMNLVYYNETFEKIFGSDEKGMEKFRGILASRFKDGFVNQGDFADGLLFESEKDGRKYTIKIKPFDYAENSGGYIVNIEDVTNTLKLLAELDITARKLSCLEERLQSLKSTEFNFGKLVSRNREMLKAIEIAKKTSRTSVPVLIKGESGTGKELMACAIHENSERRNQPMVKLNCAAIPPNLFESELFGYEAGAFSGASRCGKAGLLELADGGTLFLDEIGEMPVEMQAKLLRFLQDGTFYKVGGTKPISVNVRIITATNRPLEQLISEGKFREDLYYRINVITVEIPPLRNRPEDIILLFENFIREFEELYGTKIKRIEPGVKKVFLDYPWPGNVRELRNVIERLVILSEDGVITEDLLPRHMKEEAFFREMPRESGEIVELSTAANLAEKKVIQDTLKRYAYNKTRTAEALKISRSTLYKKIKQYNLEHLGKTE